MIVDENLKILKAELSNAIVAFEKEEIGYKLFFNNHLGFQEFKQNLNLLYYEFIKEVRNNLINLKTDEESHIYLEMLLHVFEILDDQIGLYPDFVSPHRNAKIISKTNMKFSCIHTCSEDLSQMLIYFQYQKKIIRKSIKFIRIFLKKCKKSNKQNNFSTPSWKDELKDFYPDMIRIKDEFNKISSISEKIKYLQDERMDLALKFEEEGIDLYASAINFFIESRIECLKDWLMHESKSRKSSKLDYDEKEIEIILREILHILENANSQISKDKIKTEIEKGISLIKSFPNGNITSECSESDSPSLNWTESKAALVELIYALHSSHSINGGRVDIKRIAKLFESVFSIELGDVYNTFSEIRNRKIEQTKFIDILKDSLLSKMKEIDEKSCK
jgi:hypothetical protein